MSTVATPETSAHVTVFAADWCPFCQRLLADLDRADVPFEHVDAEAPGTEEINEWIKSVNDGNRVVPTVLYSDGTSATNPSAAEVQAKLEELTA